MDPQDLKTILQGQLHLAEIEVIKSASNKDHNRKEFKAICEHRDKIKELIDSVIDLDTLIIQPLL